MGTSSMGALNAKGVGKSFNFRQVLNPFSNLVKFIAIVPGTYKREAKM